MGWGYGGDLASRKGSIAGWVLFLWVCFFRGLNVMGKTVENSLWILGSEWCAMIDMRNYRQTALEQYFLRSHSVDVENISFVPTFRFGHTNSSGYFFVLGPILILVKLKVCARKDFVGTMDCSDQSTKPEYISRDQLRERKKASKSHAVLQQSTPIKQSSPCKILSGPHATVSYT